MFVEWRNLTGLSWNKAAGVRGAFVCVHMLTGGSHTVPDILDRPVMWLHFMLHLWI